jgi:uroporphyrin-III C-methyltransferase
MSGPRPGGTGRVALVGAGPGDPDLITVRGRRLLESADVIVHDRLVQPELLELARPGSLRIDVGKMGHGRSTPQAETERLLVRLAMAGHNVVRLKGGDPFVFGRGGEEAQALEAAGVPFEVVPGVTAGVAVPAYAGIPVTQRGLARSVVFVTASEGPGSADGPDWEAIAAIDTIVAFMAGRTGPATAGRLLAAGRQPGTPVAVIRDGTLPTQEVRLTELAALAASEPPETDGRPTLVVIGDVAGLAANLDWFAGSHAGTTPLAEAV